MNQNNREGDFAKDCSIAIIKLDIKLLYFRKSANDRNNQLNRRMKMIFRVLFQDKITPELDAL